MEDLQLSSATLYDFLEKIWIRNVKQKKFLIKPVVYVKKCYIST